MDNIIAKSKDESKDGNQVTLERHTKEVINFGINTVLNNFVFDDEEEQSEFIKKLVVALILHDIGKYSPYFQDKIKNPKKYNLPKDYIYHNELSWAFSVTCIGNLYKDKYDCITSSILYHHLNDHIDNKGKCIDYRCKEIIDNIMSKNDGCIDSMINFYINMCKYVDDVFGYDILSVHDFRVIDNPEDYHEIETHIKTVKLFPVVDVENIDSFNNYDWGKMISSILNYSDRTVSSNIYDNDKIFMNDVEYIKSIYDNHIYVNSKLTPNIDQYDHERLKYQISVIDDIYNDDMYAHSIMASPGSGKTLMGIFSHIRAGRKTYWITPTTFLSDSTYDSIIDELSKMDLTIKVGLYYGSRLQKTNFNNPQNCELKDCDIIVSVIDGFLSKYSKNDLSTYLIDLYNSNVIFDEYHVFVGNEPIFAAFINLVKGRIYHSNAKTLMMSGTPINFDNFFGFDGVKYWDTIPIYGGDTKINIHIHNIDSVDNIPIKLITNNSFNIFPTVNMVQHLYNTNIKDIDSSTTLIHSRFIDEDKQDIKKRFYESYGKYSYKEKMPIIGTNIIGTGLDVSCKILTEYCVSPEETIQRIIGRCSRFKEYDEIEYNCIVSDTKNDGVNRFIKENYNSEIRNLWITEISTFNGKTITKKEFYDMYRKFINKNQKIIDKYNKKCYENSIKELSLIEFKRGGYYENENDYDTVNNSVTYRGEASNYYVTVKLPDGTYLKPMVCDKYILQKEEDLDINKNNKETGNHIRYNFMYDNDNGFNFDKNKLKYYYKMTNYRNVTMEKCKDIAVRNDRPILLCNYSYDSVIGLYQLI